MNKLNIYCLLSIFFGCTSGLTSNDKPQSNNQCIVIDIDEIEIDEVFDYSSVFDDYKIIPLETTKESLIGKISSIRFCGDYIVILDKNIGKSVYVFDLNGKFVSKIGRLGKGPGEYINPASISTNDETNEILVYDSLRDQIQVFSIEGRLVKELPLNRNIASESIEAYGDNIYLSNYITRSLSDFTTYRINIILHP